MTFVDPIDTFDSVVPSHSNINIINYFLCNLYASTFFFILRKNLIKFHGLLENIMVPQKIIIIISWSPSTVPTD